MNKAIFLDRDWVLNIDKSYVHKLCDLEVFKWNKEALKGLRELWYLLIVVTNQSWIARWYYTINECEKFNTELEKVLDIKFDEIYICPHSSVDNCNCRKPKNIHLMKAFDKYWIDFKKSYFVWDKSSDILCWKSVWTKTVFINSSIYHSDIESDLKVKNLLEFYNIIKNDLQ